MAATGTPTPNIGLRIPLGTDPVSVDDINYNSNLIDTKLGAVGNDSVQDQIDDLNSKITTTTLLGTNTNSDNHPRAINANPYTFLVVEIRSVVNGNAFQAFHVIPSPSLIATNEYYMFETGFGVARFTISSSTFGSVNYDNPPTGLGDWSVKLFGMIG